MHTLHHRKPRPTHWDLFYMHPAECFVAVVLPFAVAPRLLPLHWVAWEGMVTLGVMIDVYGHCGLDTGFFHPFKVTHYSVLPGLPWRRIFLQGAHHDEHHRLGRCNYALYLDLWDRVCATGPKEATVPPAVAS